MGASATSDNAQSVLANCLTLVSEVRKSKQPNIFADWNTIPKSIAKEFDLSFQSMPPQLRRDFEEVIQLRNKVVHAGLSWPRGFKPSADGAREPKVTVERIQALPNAFAALTVMDLIQTLHASTGTQMTSVMNKVMERFRNGTCPAL